MSITDMRKFVAPETIFGVDALHAVGQYAHKFGISRPLVVTDPGVMQAGWTNKVLESLDSAGIDSVVFSAITSNPKAEEVMAGADLYLQENCDSLIAVGGGSPLDCAKGIGIIVVNGGHILDYEGVDKIIIPMPPLIAIPTTAGTSADVSQFAIINDTTRKTKIAIISKAIIPDVALIDPQTLVTMDNYLTACTGLDALVHAIEAFISNAHSAMTDMHALEAIRLVCNNLPGVLQEPSNLELRAKTMLGSLQAGLAFSNASLGAVHAMAHSLGGYKNLPHGECNAMLLRHVIDFNYSAAPERFRTIATAMGLERRGLTSAEVRTWLLATVDQLRTQVGITNTLGSRGIRGSDIPILSKKAILDPCLVTNPRPATKRDIEVLYEEAT